MRKRLHDLLDTLWYPPKTGRAKWVSYLLTPLSVIYGCVIRLRRFAYQHGLFRQERLSVPVIVVGNITVGGTGKTPFVIKLSQLLKERGYHPGIVIRGYKGRTQQGQYGCTVITAQQEADPAVVGDEAILIARKTLCPVAVSTNRVDAGKQLIAQQHCDVIISDDGLQHYALARDLEIAVVDGARGMGNGRLLPAGPLRESQARLNTVDFVVTKGTGTAAGYYAYTRCDYAYPITLIANKKTLDCFQRSTPEHCHVIAGIGNPESFFQTLREDFGLVFTAHRFPDHYAYCAADIDFGPQAIVLMTEKDAVKVEKFADHRHWAVPLNVELSDHFVNEILDKLNVTTQL